MGSLPVPYSTDEEVRACPESCSRCPSCQLKSGSSASCLLPIFPARLGYAQGEFITSLSTPSTCSARLPLSVPFTHIHPDPLTFILVALGPAQKRPQILGTWMDKLGHSPGKWPLALRLGWVCLLWADLDLWANALCGHCPFMSLSLLLGGKPPWGQELLP